MKRTTLAAFALAVSGIGAALASGFGLDNRSTDNTILDQLSRAEAAAHARALFDRADLDRNDVLDVDEYASLSVIEAELARLNGYVAFETPTGPRRVAVDVSAPASLGRGERTLIDAVARSEFYVASGGKEVLTKTQFMADRAAAFAKSDRNGDGELVKAELSTFAARGAGVYRADA